MVYVKLVRLTSESRLVSFSFVGEMDSSGAPSIVETSESGFARDLGLPVPVLSREGEDKPIPSAAGARLMRFEVGDGVFTGEDFWGEMDLARSVTSQTRTQVSFLLICC